MKQLPKRILLGVSFPISPYGEDFAPCAHDKDTLRQGLWLASRVDAKIGVVCVHEATEFEHPSWKTLTAEWRSRVEASVRAAIPAQFQDRVDVICTAGRPWQQLIREVRRWRAELLMVSPGTDTRQMKRILHGSTTRRLLRKCPCPVWVSTASEKPEVKKALLCVDLGEVSERIVEVGNLLRTALGVETFLLHCSSYPADLGLGRQARAAQLIADYHKQVQQTCFSRIDELLGAQKGEWKIRVQDGGVAQAVPTLVEEENIDLVVLAGVSHQRLAGLLLGTTAEKILERTEATTLIVRPREWQSPFVG